MFSLINNVVFTLVTCTVVFCFASHVTYIENKDAYIDLCTAKNHLFVDD